LAELQKQQQAIDTMSLLRIICDGDNPTHAQGQSARSCGRWPGREPLLPVATPSVQIEPFQVMVSAKQLPTEHFVDYSFVF
jgi:hypothetical protein